MEKSICKTCKKKFEYNPLDRSGKYCCVSCYHKSRKGKKLSEEHCKKISIGRIGIVFTKEHRKNISKSVIGRKSKKKNKTYEYLFGKTKGDDIKNKISKNRLGKCLGHGHGFKKGVSPWNFIDGRSKFLGPDRYGDDWDKIRLIIYKRDNYTCQKCGITMAETKKAHHVHHIIPFLESLDNSLSNLITLCPSCHRKEESKLIKLKRISKQ